MSSRAATRVFQGVEEQIATGQLKDGAKLSAQAAACLAFDKRRLYLLYLTVYAVEPYVQDQKRSLLYSPRLMADPSPTDEQLEVIERGAKQAV